MLIKYLGISTLLFNDSKNAILFDACLTRPTLKQIIFTKIQTKPKLVDQILAAARIKHLDAIFISHTHYDHALDLGYLAKKFKAHVYGSTSAVNLALGASIKKDQLTTFVAGQTYQIGNFKIHVLKSVHSRPFFFNNDLGQTIDRPLKQPAYAWQFKEGGSYDFLVENQGQKYLIRPSFGYLPGELKQVQADYLFLGITTLVREQQAEQINFFKETIAQVKPKLVVPLHWDNFTRPLTQTTTYMPFARRSMKIVCEYCQTQGIKFIQMPPLSQINL